MFKFPLYNGTKIRIVLSTLARTDQEVLHSNQLFKNLSSTGCCEKKKIDFIFCRLSGLEMCQPKFRKGSAPKLRGHLRHFLPGRLLSLPSNLALFPGGGIRRRPLRANAPFRNAAADQCQCGRRPPARSPGCAWSSPPLPHRLLPTAPAQARHASLGLKSEAARPAGRLPSRGLPSHAAPPKGHLCSRRRKRGGREAPRRSPRPAPFPLPPPVSTQSAGPPTRPPGLPAPIEPGLPRRPLPINPPLSP